MYTQLVDRVASSRRYWEAEGYETRIAGVVWVQGEADARVFDMATAYEANLQAFIAALRTDLGAPDAPFVLGQIRGSDFPFRDVVRAAQQSVGASSLGAYLVESDDLTTFEGLHFDTPSQLELGRRYATAMLGAASSLEGDVNADGAVDVRDLNHVRNNFGGAGLGDATRDGRIDLADLNLVRNRFGTGTPAPVPEPATWAIACASLLAAGQFRRRWITSSARSRASRLGSSRSRCSSVGR